MSEFQAVNQAASQLIQGPEEIKDFPLQFEISAARLKGDVVACEPNLADDSSGAQLRFATLDDKHFDAPESQVPHQLDKLSAIRG
jgi:hypothetical protein